MKVINGHDYWDSASAYGVDETVCIVRNSKRDQYDFVSTDYFFPIINYTDKETNKTKLLPLGAILTCGKAYPFAFHTISDPSRNHERIYDLIPTQTIYNANELESLHPEMNKKSIWRGSELDNFNSFINQKAFKEKAVTEFLINNKAAIALILPDRLSYGGRKWRTNGGDPTCEKSMVWTNPSFLKDYNFYKIKDSFTMFMEVSNWVSGVLPNSIETVEISDKSKIVKAGFDVKNSFRKAKQK